jgi:hypothetical protein
MNIHIQMRAAGSKSFLRCVAEECQDNKCYFCTKGCFLSHKRVVREGKDGVELYDCVDTSRSSSSDAAKQKSDCRHVKAGQYAHRYEQET